MPRKAASVHSSVKYLPSSHSMAASAQEVEAMATNNRSAFSTQRSFHSSVRRAKYRDGNVGCVKRWLLPRLKVVAGVSAQVLATDRGGRVFSSVI